MLRPLTLALSAALLAACTGNADHDAAPEISSDIAIILTPIAEGLEFPWGMATLPSGDILVTEREGRLRIIRKGVLDQTALTGTPQDVLVERQGGYLDVAIHPDFETNRLVYMTYSQGTSEANRTALIRGRLNAEATGLTDVEEIFASHVPGKQGGVHFGSRIAFLPDGTILVTLGDGFRWMDEAQNPENHFGKIVRINDDGTPAPGNPFAGAQGPAAQVYSYGHRNVQGLAYDSARGIIYAHEHGPMGGDELNIIEPGTNYGWPEITYGVNYDGTVITNQTEADGMAQPETRWVPSIAPSGMVVYSGDVYPGWNGDLIIGAMNGPDGRKLVRIDLDEAGNVVGREDLLADKNMAFRDVEIGNDGHIYLATAELYGEIFRLDVVDPANE